MCQRCLRAEAGQRDRAGKQFQRAAFRVFHVGVAGQGEGGHVAAEIAGQFEIFQGDAGAGGEGKEQEQGKGKKGSSSSSIQVHGPNAPPFLEEGAFHEPERRSPTRPVGKYSPASSRVGDRRSNRLGSWSQWRHFWRTGGFP